LQVNELPYVNTLKSIFDGNQSQTVAMNQWNQEVFFTGVSNGL